MIFLYFEQANYLAANGIVVVASFPVDIDCNAMGALRRTVLPPGSASFAITVNATDIQGSVTRSDDVAFQYTAQGPRCDYDGMCPSSDAPQDNLNALKPDLSAPGDSSNPPGCGAANPGLSYYTNMQWGTYCGTIGTSPAAAIVSGAAALVLQKFPRMTPDSLKWLLIANADKSHNRANETGPWGSWDNEHRTNMKRWNPCEKVLNVKNVGKLGLKWSYNKGGSGEGYVVPANINHSIRYGGRGSTVFMTASRK